MVVVYLLKQLVLHSCSIKLDIHSGRVVRVSPPVGPKRLPAFRQYNKWLTVQLLGRSATALHRNWAKLRASGGAFLRTTTTTSGYLTAAQWPASQVELGGGGGQGWASLQTERIALGTFFILALSPQLLASVAAAAVAW